MARVMIGYGSIQGFGAVLGKLFQEDGDVVHLFSHGPPGLPKESQVFPLYSEEAGTAGGNDGIQLFCLKDLSVLFCQDSGCGGISETACRDATADLGGRHYHLYVELIQDVNKGLGDVRIDIVNETAHKEPYPHLGVRQSPGLREAVQDSALGKVWHPAPAHKEEGRMSEAALSLAGDKSLAPGGHPDGQVKESPPGQEVS